MSPVSLGGSSYFLWKRCVVFQQMKNNFYLPCQFFENRRSMRMLLFLPYDRSNQTFYSQTIVNSKTSKVITSRCYAWSLGIKKSLNRQGSVLRLIEELQAYLSLASFAFYRPVDYKHFPEYFFSFARFYVIIHQKIDFKRSSTYRCPFY